MGIDGRTVSVKTDSVIAMVKKQYDAEGCGICEKKGAEVLWFSPYSQRAHAKCLKIIEPSEETLALVLNVVFKNAQDYRAQNSAHIRAIKAVREACGSKTILKYQKEYGAEALFKLFNTLGIKAALALPSSL